MRVMQGAWYMDARCKVPGTLTGAQTKASDMPLSACQTRHGLHLNGKPLVP